MEGLIEGRIVHYVPNTWEGWNFAREHRPAIVVKVWTGGDAPNLIVFVDGSNDFPLGSSHSHLPGDGEIHTVWRTSVPFSDEKTPGTWHWIERDALVLTPSP